MTLGPNSALYLVLVIDIAGPPEQARGTVVSALNSAFETAGIACLLIKPEPGKALNADVARSAVTLAQQRGIACLIQDDINMARKLGADGVHLSWSKDVAQRFRTARAALDGGFMIGADAGRSRDDAMTLGELGADYVAFGIPPHVEDRSSAEARQRDLISWWSGIFEVPCAAFDVAAPETAAALAAQGADFVGVEIMTAQPPHHVKDRLTAFARSIHAQEADA